METTKREVVFYSDWKDGLEVGKHSKKKKKGKGIIQEFTFKLMQYLH